jgi:hypothetical protein
MDSETLKAAQGPLKQRYRDEPGAALITLHARGAIGEGVTCSVETGQAPGPASIRPPVGRSPMSARATCCSRRWSLAPASP